MESLHIFYCTETATMNLAGVLLYFISGDRLLCSSSFGLNLVP